MNRASFPKSAILLIPPLLLLLSGCTNGEEEAEADLPELPPVSESEVADLDALFGQEQDPDDSPAILSGAFPEYNWNQARAIGSVDDFGLWVTRQEDSTCLIIALREGEDAGFSSGQQCKSEAEFEASGIQQAVRVGESQVNVWVYPQSVDVESGWQPLNSFVAVPER